MTLLDGLERELRKAYPDLELRKNEPMSRHTTFRVGGPAALMALPKTVEEAQATLRTAAELGIEPFFLGNGSNLLVADEGYPGFVVKLAGRLEEVHPVPPSKPGENTRLEAGAAALLSRLSRMALDLGLTGLEFAGGIPGSVGGAVTMNAGAYGGEMSQTLAAVTCLDEKGSEFTLSSEKCNFSYRNSVFFKHPEWLIIKVELDLRQGDRAEIKKRMDDLSTQRRAKQPLEYPSAGSTFKRPAPLPDGAPVYAAALIDQCGCKGLTVGGAQVSEKHAGFIINRGGAACADILALIGEVRKRVYDRTGVRLELEVKTLGV